ncbi:MAG: NifU family protein [Actinomycetota bacterium]|nr:NifU family protein [Actinomycetota bacterium]
MNKTSDQQELQSERYQEVADLIEMIRPAVQSDGGDLRLVDVNAEEGIVDVELQGSCSSCAISSVTLQAGIERIIKGRLQWVTEVRGGVDESMDFEESFAMGRGGYVPRGY